MFADAPWPLAKVSEKKTWMQTNSDQLSQERYLAIDAMKKAMLLPANCPELWDNTVLRSELVTFVPHALFAATLSSTTVKTDNGQPAQQVLERSNRLAKSDTNTTHNGCVAGRHG